MSNHGSEDDFLTVLYQQTATEKPPVDLDQQILALAKANHQRTRFAMTMNVQRVLSVAAVMVLSVYIFFEVGGDRHMSIDEDFMYPQKSNLRSTPAAQQAESLDMRDEVHAKKQFKNKKAKKSVERAMADYETDAISEIAVEAQEQSESDMLGPSAEFLPAPKLMRQKLKAERALEPANAEAMLKEIEQLLASGKLARATRVYGQLKIFFPDYPVPVFISDVIDNHKN
jgi:hypothetical protein